MFQFQYGAIISNTSAGTHTMHVMFQFQYGAIISRTKSRKIKERSEVSIPIWCDYKKNEDEKAVLDCMFQFQYGAIIS